MGDQSKQRHSRVKNKRIKAQISNSNITKNIKIFKTCPYYKFLKILSSLQSFLFETSTVEIAKLTNSQFLTIWAQIGCFFPFLIHFKNVFRQSVNSKISPEYPKATECFESKTNLK